LILSKKEKRESTRTRLGKGSAFWGIKEKTADLCCKTIGSHNYGRGWEDGRRKPQGKKR